MSDGDKILCGSVGLSLIAAIFDAVKKRTPQLEISNVIGNWGNTTTLLTGIAILWRGLTAAESATLSVKEYRSALVVSGLVMMIYGFNQLIIMFGFQPIKEAEKTSKEAEKTSKKDAS